MLTSIFLPSNRYLSELTLRSFLASQTTYLGVFNDLTMLDRGMNNY